MKLHLMQLVEDTRCLVEDAEQRKLGWVRLEAELSGLRAVNVEHGFRVRLSQAHGHIDLKRLRAALLSIKVRGHRFFFI